MHAMSIPVYNSPTGIRRFARERADMVQLIRERGVADEQVLAAMNSVERHQFLPEHFVARAYDDTSLPIGEGQTISQPYTVAFMTEALHVKRDDKVLEIGTGSGYQAAVLAALGVRVFTIERSLELLATARKTLERLRYRVASRGGDGTVGWTAHAPYNGIIVTAAAPDVPRPLLDQLAEGGRLVIPVGDREVQSVVVIERHDAEFTRTEAPGFKFVPLIGKNGW
jgi:protein-L-isoaspartate(D-aspartate) O-methyltransferase